MSADNVRGWEIVRKMNMKFWGQSLSQGHYQPTYQQARKGFIYFITLPLIFTSYLNCSQKARVDLTTNRCDCWERVNLNGLTIFPLWLDQNSTGCDVNETFAVAQNTWRFLVLVFWFLFYCLLCNFSNNIPASFLMLLSLDCTKKGHFSSMYNNKYENWNSRAGLFPANFSFFSRNQRRRTNIKSDGGYCVITVQHVMYELCYNYCVIALHCTLHYLRLSL